MTDKPEINTIEGINDLVANAKSGEVVGIHTLSYRRGQVKISGVSIKEAPIKEIPDKRVEAMARAICITDGVDPDASGHAMRDETLRELEASYPLWKARIKQAQAAISADPVTALLKKIANARYWAEEGQAWAILLDEPTFEELKKWSRE